MDTMESTSPPIKRSRKNERNSHEQQEEMSIEFMVRRCDLSRITPKHFRKLFIKANKLDQMCGPIGIDIDPITHNLIISDMDICRLQVISNKGTLVRTIAGAEGDLNIPNGLSTNEHGRVFVCECYKQKVRVFDIDSGKDLFSLPTKSVNQCVTISQSDRIFVSIDSGQVVVLDSSGQTIDEFGSGVVQFPCGLALNGHQDLLVCDAGNHRMCVFDQNGQLISWFALHNGALNLTIDAFDRIIVSNWRSSELLFFDADFEQIGKYESNTNTDGKLRNPHGMCIDSLGNLIVCDTSNNCLKVVQPPLM